MKGQTKLRYSSGGVRSMVEPTLAEKYIRWRIVVSVDVIPNHILTLRPLPSRIGSYCGDIPGQAVAKALDFAGCHHIRKNTGDEWSS